MTNTQLTYNGYAIHVTADPAYPAPGQGAYVVYYSKAGEQVFGSEYRTDRVDPESLCEGVAEYIEMYGAE